MIFGLYLPYILPPSTLYQILLQPHTIYISATSCLPLFIIFLTAPYIDPSVTSPITNVFALPFDLCLRSSGPEFLLLLHSRWLCLSFLQKQPACHAWYVTRLCNILSVTFACFSKFIFFVIVSFRSCFLFFFVYLLFLRELTCYLSRPCPRCAAGSHGFPLLLIQLPSECLKYFMCWDSKKAKDIILLGCFLLLIFKKSRNQRKEFRHI